MWKSRRKFIKGGGLAMLGAGFSSRFDRVAAQQKPATLTESLGFAFDIFGTRDKGDQTADYFTLSNPSTTFNTEIDGQLYGLSLQFGDIVSNGYSTGDSFHSHEGTTASGILYGSFYMYDPDDLSGQLTP